MEEIKNPQQQNDDNIDYIEAIKTLKETTVPKDQYEKLQKEKKQLLDTLLEGGQLEQSQVEQKRSAKDIRNELFSEAADDYSNLEFVSKALELREAVLEEEGVDIFVPTGSKIMPEPDDYATAERVAEAFQSCIEYANGDSEVFTNELMRITMDVGPARQRGRK